MPIVALVLFAVFAALGFGWRSWEQRRRTGSTGFRGVSGRPGSVEWFAGVGFVAALAVAVLAPVLQLLGVVSPVSVLDAPWTQITGIVIALIGIFATVYAQLDMGDSWRIGVYPGETTTLVRTGVFGGVRNPIFTAMIAFGFGIALVTPKSGGDRRLPTSGGDDRASGAHRRRAVFDRHTRRLVSRLPGARWQVRARCRPGPLDPEQSTCADRRFLGPQRLLECDRLRIGCRHGQVDA